MAICINSNTMRLILNYKGGVVVDNSSPCMGLGHSFFLHDNGNNFMALSKVW